MVIAEKSPASRHHKRAPDNTLNNVKSFVCKYLC